MSGFVSGLARAGAVIQGVGQSAANLAGLLDGGAAGVLGTAAPGGVNIGGIDLYAFEIPDKVTWGSEEQIVEKRLPGGGKVLQLMGNDYLPISIVGMILGPDAVDRARLLEQLVLAEQLTTLTFGDFQYNVVPKRFEADYLSPFWQGHFQLECVTMPDDPAPGDAGDDPDDGDAIGASSAAMGGALNDVANGLSQAAATAQGIISTGAAVLNTAAGIVLPVTSALGVSVPFLSTAQAALNTASGAVVGLGNLAAGTAAIGAAADSLSTAASAITTGMQASGAAIALAAANAPGSDLLSVSDLLGATTAAGVQAMMCGMGFATDVAQGQLASTAGQIPVVAADPAAGWTPDTSSAACAAANADRLSQQSALLAASGT